MQGGQVQTLRLSVYLSPWVPVFRLQPQQHNPPDSHWLSSIRTVNYKWSWSNWNGRWLCSGNLQQISHAGHSASTKTPLTLGNWVIDLILSFSISLFLCLGDRGTTRILEMLGRFFKIWIKWKLKDFQITQTNILSTIEHREHNKCLNWEMLHFYPLNEVISNVMPATGLKKVGTGATKGWKSKKFW